MLALQRAVDDIAWAGHSPCELRQAIQTLWKRSLWAHTDASRGRLITYAATVAAEHHGKHARLLSIRRSLPCDLSGALDPLVEHHGAMHAKYDILHFHLRALDALP
jgi:hypothetical protein